MTHLSQRPLMLTEADRALPATREFGVLDFLYGVVAPLACFSLLLAALGGAATWPISIYVLTCVVAFVASFGSSRADGAVDALLHGAVVGAALFAIPWAVGIGALSAALVFGLALDYPSAAPIALLVGSGPVLGAFVYIRRWRRRWPRPDEPRTRLGLRLAGAALPAVACLALWGGLVLRADQVEQSVVASPLEADLDALEIWRVLAPDADWDAIHSAHRDARDRKSKRALEAAYVALTGRRSYYAGAWD